MPSDLRRGRAGAADVTGFTGTTGNRRPADDDLAVVVKRALIAVVALAALVAACGKDEPSTLVGYRLDPAPSVGDLSLGDAATGEPVAFTARPNGLMLVYFGYTSCPDMCPTTMTYLRGALNRLDSDGVDISTIDTSMVTVDPARDTGSVLPGYITSYIANARGLRTDDPAELATAAKRFGVSYSVTGSGAETEVSHSGSLYIVNDQGGVIDVMPFGVTADDMVNDLRILLKEAGK